MKWNIHKRREKTEFHRGEECLLTEQMAFSIQEAYRSARTNLMFLPRQGDSKCQKLVFTSASAGEGKSTNCTNLAISFAENEKKVLLIDCDMRKPSVHHLTNLEQAPGLSEFLAGMEEQVSIHANAIRDGLDVITAGAIPPNPAELLSSQGMGDLLRRLEREYDYICLDSPPINVVTDALVLAKEVSGFILVVRANSTTYVDIDEALFKLQQVDAHAYGILLNDVRYKNGSYKHYAYKKKYGYGYGHGYGYGYGYEYRKPEDSQVQRMEK